ncbi:MAG TPA: glycoside hydrolase family 43 protein [Phycisphaerae bacterium]|nr:glycoside hydrolase family 43 protein [Phycisphaerae bacterium]
MSIAPPFPLSFQNPVYPAYFADPFCFYHDGTYYAVGTGKDEADACPITGNVVPMITSKDLHNWNWHNRVLIPPPEEKSGPFWAPEIATDGQRFYLYYSPGGTKKGFHLRVAVADHPLGPYHDTGKPLTNLAATPFAIDAHAFQDDDGQWYMFYAADFLDILPGPPPTFRGTALVVDRMSSMTSLEGNPRTVMRAHHAWQLFQKDRDMYGQIADWYTLEGPTVLKREGKYYLFYSGGCFQNDTYGVDYLIADHPLGPWHEPAPHDLHDRGPQVIRTIPGKILGPGHNSIVTAQDGHDYICYHAWNHSLEDRELWIDPLLWTPTGPVVERFAAYIHQKNEESRNNSR